MLSTTLTTTRWSSRDLMQSKERLRRRKYECWRRGSYGLSLNQLLSWGPWRWSVRRWEINMREKRLPRQLSRMEIEKEIRAWHPFLSMPPKTLQKEVEHTFVLCDPSIPSLRSNHQTQSSTHSSPEEHY